eukprot:455014-Alexandrium_andersonii.AAC.1
MQRQCECAATARRRRIRSICVVAHAASASEWRRLEFLLPRRRTIDFLQLLGLHLARRGAEARRLFAIP